MTHGGYVSQSKMYAGWEPARHAWTYWVHASLPMRLKLRLSRCFLFLFVGGQGGIYVYIHGYMHAYTYA